MTEESPRRVVINLTSNEYQQLLDIFVDSAMVGSKETYDQNHPFGDFIPQILKENPEADVHDYTNQSPSVRYTEPVTMMMPPGQYKSLRENYKSTPIADDKNGHYALSGNAPFSEYLRRCLVQSLN